MFLSRQISWAICGLIACATTADVIYAQGGGGAGRGQQSRTRFELATLPEVQSELKLNDEQKKLATAQLAKLREKRQAAAGGGGAGGAGGQAMRAEMAKMNAEMDAEFVSKLDGAQKTRLNGLIAQVNGAAALLDPAIAKAVELSEEQIAKLKSANEANLSARREALQGLQAEERQAAMAKLTTAESKSLLAVLTEAQTKKLESLKGTALTMDQTPLRPGRGNRGQ